jgi:predicted DNA-binding transcriptional regulator AlpA
MPDNTKLVLELGDLATLLGRSPETIRKDLHRNPAAVPPRLVIPGTRLLRWRAVDVHAWLAKRVEGARHA